MIRLRDDYTSVQVREFAKHCQDSRQTRRLLSIAAVYDGMSRADAAKVGGMDRQTLRDWVHRFNAHGPNGLVNRRGGGPKSLLSASQKHELAQIVAARPDPELDGVVRWRRIDLVHVIKERFGVSIKERTISNLLKELGFSRMSVRPQHPKQNKRVIKEFKKTSQPRLKRTQVIF